jgi:lysophospholipase L1-like esterase
LVGRAVPLPCAVALALAMMVATTLAAPSPAGADPTARAAQSKTPPVEYYVAMGDSMAAGVGATEPADDYVNLVYQHELAQYPGLQLVNLACSGATTGSVVNGPGCSYSTGTQLGDAEAFLEAHPGQVPLLTIDIGANDVDGCLSSSGINTGCVQTGLAQITTYLPQILSGVTAADPGLPVYGMDYYDPFLDQWLTGASGQAVAEQSESYAVALNALLGQLYSAGNAAMADPATLFQTSDFALTGSYDGMTVPENVALICAWTLMCTEDNIHPNDAGHAEVAEAFEQVIDQVAITTTELPSLPLKSSYAVGLAATGGHPPYTWSLVRGDGKLPPGLRLKRSTGVISGKATTAGVFSFTVRVIDTKVKVKPVTQHVATQQLSITVN